MWDILFCWFSHLGMWDSSIFGIGIVMFGSVVSESWLLGFRDKSVSGHSVTVRETVSVSSADINGATAFEVSGTAMLLCCFIYRNCCLSFFWLIEVIISCIHIFCFFFNHLVKVFGSKDLFDVAFVLRMNNL